jgi:inosine-uridine nucleoside N-ribohydrolase
MCDPELDVVGVTATAGVVSGRVATRNVQAVIELIDPRKRPRFGASQAPPASLPLEGGAVCDFLAEANGPSGLGDLEVHVPELHNPHESAKLMVDLVRDQPNEITLLTLGPLTNVELACERMPDFLGHLKGLVCLAGAVSSGGDVTAAAEFNVYANPEAARTILLSPATKTLVPLDIAANVVLTFQQFDRLPGASSSNLAKFLHDVLPYSLRAHHEFLGLEGLPLASIVALAAVARPNLFTTSPMAVDVETSGELTRGMTIFDRRGVAQWQTNIDVACEVDGQGIVDYLTSVVSSAS